MANRVELKDADIEKVVGGAFNFYTKGDNEKCYVDGLGTYYVSDGAFEWVVNRTAGSDVSSAQVVKEAISLGYFWK